MLTFSIIKAKVQRGTRVNKEDQLEMLYDLQTILDKKIDQLRAELYVPIIPTKEEIEFMNKIAKVYASVTPPKKIVNIYEIA